MDYETSTWGESLDESWVKVERVIAYWSRLFKQAEKRYSTTEREALAAKEALVRFQPFIEGDKVVQPRPEWKRTRRRAKRQDQNCGKNIRSRLQGQGKGGTLVKLLATPPTHHLEGCPRRRGSKVQGIAEIGPRYRRENGPSTKYLAYIQVT
ncbi:hypothetical protein BDP27DRAFT_1362945 [Rhodocollybia butyracea]|uniref:Reverse transcriptase/retrotransposon-derived protein RNase H-like domain-containing protein n=1 Tax=Rhodocollybia butyracea TaxID=206335 RepID=A0A9P5U9H3_9AGAR|nr:hypothetical protein BDP27DRAFT_1362945 [Rhodocollybia butyracea]